MQFFASAVTTLQTLVVALGAGLAVWGVVNLLEGYGSDIKEVLQDKADEKKAQRTAQAQTKHRQQDMEL